jgi:hypothetical protein
MSCDSQPLRENSTSHFSSSSQSENARLSYQQVIIQPQVVISHWNQGPKCLKYEPLRSQGH